MFNVVFVSLYYPYLPEAPTQLHLILNKKKSLFKFIFDIFHPQSINLHGKSKHSTQITFKQPKKSVPTAPRRLMTQIFMCRMLIEIESLPVNHIFSRNKRQETREKKVRNFNRQLSFRFFSFFFRSATCNNVARFVMKTIRRY